MPETPGKPDEVSKTNGSLSAMRQRRSLIGKRHHDVLDHTQLLNQVVRLEDETQVAAPHPRERFVIKGGHIPVAKDVSPRCWPIKTAE